MTKNQNQVLVPVTRDRKFSHYVLLYKQESNSLVSTVKDTFHMVEHRNT